MKGQLGPASRASSTASRLRFGALPLSAVVKSQSQDSKKLYLRPNIRDLPVNTSSPCCEAAYCKSNFRTILKGAALFRCQVTEMVQIEWHHGLMVQKTQLAWQLVIPRYLCTQESAIGNCPVRQRSNPQLAAQLQDSTHWNYLHKIRTEALRRAHPKTECRRPRNLSARRLTASPSTGKGVSAKCQARPAAPSPWQRRPFVCGHTLP